MGCQLELPFLDPNVVASWQHLEAQGRDASRDGAPKESGQSAILTTWERLRDLLERCYLDLRDEHPFGPAFRAAWVRTRRRLCDEHGWTEDEFYDELTVRRRVPPTVRVIG